MNKLESTVMKLAPDQYLPLVSFMDITMRSNRLTDLLNGCMSQLPKIIKGESFKILVNDNFSGKYKEVVKVGITDRVLQRFQEIILSDPLWRTMVSSKHTITNRTLYQDVEWEQTNSYRYLMKPSNLFHVLIAPVVLEDELSVTIHINRSFKHPFSADEIECVELLSYYMSRGAESMINKLKLESSIKNMERLTTRELEVLQFLAKGFKDSKIAIKLGISLYTVKDHLKKIYYKFGVSSRSEAIIKAIQIGLLDAI